MSKQEEVKQVAKQPEVEKVAKQAIKDEKDADAPKQEAPKKASVAALSAAVVAGPKKVKIQALEDHTTTVGGAKYSFIRSREYEVPEDVAMILQHANKAIRKG